MSRLDAWLSQRLAAWVERVTARSVPIVWLCLLATVGLGAYAGTQLRINSDNLALVSEDLPARRNHAAFAEVFPNLESALFVVIDAETPELVRSAAERLEERLAALPELCESVYSPGGGDFFLEHGLLYRSVEDLEAFADRIVAMQPIIASLERDSSIGSFSRLVRRGLAEVHRGEGEGAEQWPAVLDRVSQATVDVYAEGPVAVSWDEILLRGSALETSTRRVIVVHATLDFASPLAAARAVHRIHDEARGLGLAPESGVRVRVTGNPALNYEEMLGIAWDIGMGGLFCLVLVAGILHLALGSWKLVLAALATLVIGLVWAAAIAAATVGHLTLVSLCVAILFIGLGIDFAIHLGMRYGLRIRDGRTHREALREATEDVGSSLALCTLTTAIAFLVFVPTPYLGVAELGLIAGLSMLAIAFLTFTLFPALLSSWLALRGEVPGERPLLFEDRLGVSVSRHAAGVRWAALAIFAAGLLLIPRARFDPNVVDMRDPGTESVQAFNELLAQTGVASPWYVDAVAPDLAAAEELAAELEGLPSVDRTLTLADYVPDEQEEKLAILEELAFLLGPPQAPARDEPPPAREQVESLAELRDFLADAVGAPGASPLDASMLRLRQHLDDFLSRVEREGDPEAALARLEELLLSNLSQQLGRLRRALEPSEVTLATLPEDLVSRLRAPDGRARVQIFPRRNLRSEGSMREFTEQVASVAPSASGIAFNLLAFEEATKRSFVQALCSAVALITALLIWLWRRLSETLLVLAPLVMSAVLSVAAMGLLGIDFNFANVIVIPLMFGIGVDSGIHLVHRARDIDRPGEHLLGTTTARAVFYSALTTTVSFGSLAFSSHVGMSGLGVLLAIGMLLTVFCNLVVLPALLAWRRG